MTVLSATNRNDYVGTGTTGPFAYTFKIFADTDLVVTVRDLGGIETTLVLNSDYTVTGVGTATGGNVTLLLALTSGYALTVRRVRPVLQSTDLRNQGRYYPDTVEDCFDRGTMVDQQLDEELSGTVRLAETVNPATFDPTLPANMVAGDAIVVNIAGTGLSMGGLSAAQLSAWSASHNQVLDSYTSAHSDFTPGVTTALTLSSAPGNLSNVIVTRRTSGADFIYLSDEYSVVGSVITFTSPIPASTTRVEVRHFYTYQINIGQAQNIETIATGTGAVTRNVRDVLRGHLRAADFGVVGDGSTDDTTNMQKALTAGAAQNKVVDGESLVVKITSALTCAGPGLVFDTVPHGNAGGPGIVVSGSGYTALTVTGIVREWAVCVYGSGNTANGILFQNPILGVFGQTRVFHLDGYGVKINKCYDCVFVATSVEQCGNASQYAFSVNNDGDTSNMSHFVRIQVEKATAKAIFIDSNTLSCLFDNIHSEQAVPSAGVNTWFFGGARCAYRGLRLASNAPAANATCYLSAAENTMTNLLTEGAIDVVFDVFSTSRLELISPEIQGTAHVLNAQTGTVVIHGGNIASMPTNCGFLRVHDSIIGTLTLGISNNPADPTYAQFTGCSIATLASSSTLSAATFERCTIAEGGNLLRGAMVLLHSQVACAGTVAHSSGTLTMVESTLSAALTYTNGGANAAIRMSGHSRITGTVQCGDAGNVDILATDGCTVGGSSSGVGVPTGGAHVVGARHVNMLPSELGTSFSPTPTYSAGKYVLDGWVCTVAGTPGTWLQRRTLTGN